MGVKVSFFNTDATDNYDKGSDWEFFSTDNGDVLTVLDENGNKLASYARWDSVTREPKTNQEAQLEEAIELVSLVDAGKFTNQDSDWRERAQELLGE